MITIGEMQFSGMLTMMMLSVMLALCVPRRSARYGSFARARWMMAAGTGLLAVQFALQYIFGFRQMGVTQAVLINLLFFTPASLLCSMAILYVQRQGSVAPREWLTVGSIYGLSALILLVTVMFDGIAIRQESTALRMADYVGAMLYVVMQSYIFKQQYAAYKQVELAVGEYYDRERSDLFDWMGWSTKGMALLAFLVPLVIFLHGAPLVLFSIAYFFCIAYSTISLYSYGISEDVEQVEESLTTDYSSFLDEPSGRAERNVKHSSSAQPTMFKLQPSIFNEKVERWKQSAYYLEHNLTLAVVARQMGVPRKQLQEWLHHSEYKKLAGLVTSLRIEEAKRVLRECPDWSIESVAEHCGFNDRKYFHHVFQQLTGTTPAKYQRQQE